MGQLVPWSKYIPHHPTERQATFLIAGAILAAEHPTTKSEILYGGAAGGGKSDALLMDALGYADVPGYSALILRRTYPDLALPGAIMDRSHEWLEGKAKWNDRDKQWRFDSGARLTFGFLATDMDQYRYQSAEFQYIGFDELTQFDENQYRYMFSRLRRTKKADKKGNELSHVPLRMRGASNPGGTGHAWVKKRFPVDRDPNAGGPFFVPAKIQDNPHLDQEAYVSSLEELDQVTRQRYLEGDWGIFEDAAFPEFIGDIENNMHVISKFVVPDEWNRFEGLDHGRRNPTAWHHWAVDYDGNIICVTEYYMPNKLVRENVPEIKKARDRVYHHKNSQPVCWADPSIKNRTGVLDPKGREISVELEYVDCGMNVSYAQNNRQAGYVRMSTLIVPDDEHPFPDWHPRYGEYGSPKLFIFETCVELIDQLTTATREKSGPLMNEAIDASWEGNYGHACASARYATMSRPMATRRPDVWVEPDPVLARKEAMEEFSGQHVESLHTTLGDLNRSLVDV
tara:strand:- start:28292 stop:29827 length:1536 start_codon:yes stop_codon:yes gene_type:complete